MGLVSRNDRQYRDRGYSWLNRCRDTPAPFRSSKPNIDPGRDRFVAGLALCLRKLALGISIMILSPHALFLDRPLGPGISSQFLRELVGRFGRSHPGLS